MERKITILLVLLFAIARAGISQILDSESQAFIDDLNHLKQFTETKDNSYEGSPYLNDDFMPGTIIMENGKDYTNIPLRYNVFYDNFEFTIDNKAMALQKSKEFKSFIIGSHTFIYTGYEYKGKKEHGYLELLVQGDFSLYLKHTVKLRDAEDSGAFKESSKATFFPQKPDFLLGAKEANIVQVENGKEMLRLFGDLEESINNYTDNKKLKLKKERDYFNLVNYLNSL